jgi:hypothetical protein
MKSATTLPKVKSPLTEERKLGSALTSAEMAEFIDTLELPADLSDLNSEVYEAD